jgi:hypothetical protein
MMKQSHMMAAMVIILFACGMRAAGQEFIKAGEAAFREKYAAYDFKGNFAVKIQSDEINNYYLVDISSFANRFEKIYFMNLTFSAQKIVNIDHDLDKRYVCFISILKYPADEIVGIFKDLKEETIRAAGRMTVGQQSEWLKKNDKYK